MEGIIEKESDIKEIMKNLLGEDYETKTNLSKDDIKNINALYAEIEILRNNYSITLPNIENTIKYFLKLKISEKRESRREAVEAVGAVLRRQSEDEDESDAMRYGKVL